jgi:NAD(P)-dependent dehydrogenase (short-subunit alcohol dehydrogenase family)
MIKQGQGRLSGKVALVTGGSRGIGKAVAAAYAMEGAKVFICARNAADLANAIDDVRRTGGEILGLAGDVADPDHVRNIVDTALLHFGEIDVLVNNASLLGPRVPIVDYPYSAWREVMRVNVDGPFLMTQAVLRTMLPRGAGSIINVSSGVGRVGKAQWGAYSSSKFAIEGFTQMLAEELSGTGIRVNALNPGATRTAMRAAAYPDENPLTLPRPEDLAPAFVYLACDESLTVTGKSLEARDWL